MMSRARLPRLWLWLPLALAPLLSGPAVQVSGARILAAVPMRSASHFRVLQPLLRALAHRGHHLTVISHFPQQPPPPNYTDISLNSAATHGRAPSPYLPMREGSLPRAMWRWSQLCDKTAAFCREAYAAPAVRRLLASDARFDLVLAEAFAGDCMAGLAHRFRAPLVGVVSSVALPWVHDRMGNPDHPAYMENFFLSMVAPLGFWERTANSAFYLLMRLANWWLSERVIDEVERAALGSALPPTSRLVYNTSLMLLNSHFSLNQPIPLVPAMIEVGGLHIEQPKPLPKELQEFFDSSEHGVVYFSMGTMLRVDALPQEQLRGILRAFASLPQKVLWKADHTLLPPLPPNVHTSEWLPQNDILNHPKTVAFVTHGGMLGLQEAVAAGVPMLVVPVLGDQPHNAASLSSRGVALTLTVNQLTEHNVRHALDSLVNDTSYRKRMKQLSALFRDRPRPPLEEAVYWVEYVIRHRGAPHLRSAALDLAWYQYLLLDVAALVLATVLLALASVYAGLRWILGPLLVGNRAQRKKIKSN
ncbi:UDP-glucosyltransferase 2-like isoform X1 [Schistocerca gregaria]|uniref:UDP-glucosyltransferase 2-like isoform X1 n=1 Tax=Schistocerca gregaria TaxID=7010 RepID=UPI00211E4D90|nr:UDP-glucosyltransferase 2-like isoform X1 [Schistocerca gregaria]XP_049832175.1 UDP-glucosyltransferase 2-like isoform X1 [Schistocerca gregaria]